MIDLPFLASAAPAAVTRPAVEVTFGGDADGWSRSLVSIAVEAGLAPAVDAAELRVAGTSAPDVAVGDEGEISLGYGDAPEVVFSGKVHAVARDLRSGLRITATNAGATLAALRVNQSYRNQTAGDIVGDLVSQAGVQSDNVADGSDFPFYAVDDRRSAYQHIAAIAAKCACLAYVTAEGAVTVRAVADEPPVRTFAFGGDVIALELAETAALAGEVTAVGEGAAGSKGADAWSRLVKDRSAVEGAGGSGDPKRLLPDGSLRSADAVKSAASGRAVAAQLASVAGRLVVPGAPTVVVGSTIEVSDAPDSALNGKYLVREVRHRVAKRSGFTTELGVVKSGEGALGALAGLLGGLL